MHTRFSFIVLATLGYSFSCTGKDNGVTGPITTGLNTSSAASVSSTATSASGPTGVMAGTTTSSAEGTGSTSVATGATTGGTSEAGGTTGATGTTAPIESTTIESTTGTSDTMTSAETGGTHEFTGGDSGETSSTNSTNDGFPEFAGAGCDAEAGAYGVENAKLPNPFQMNDGSIVASMAQWECRRAEIIQDLQEYEVGPKPAPPEVAATFSGGTLNVQVTTPSGTLTLTSNISGTGDCVIIGTAGGNLVTGCRSMAFNHDQVVRNDHSSGNAWPDDPYYDVYPELYEEAPYGGDPVANGNLKIGNYSAWSWGVSRLIDGLELTKEQHGIDLSKIGVHGCSYGGKMALWAGALDQRIALTIAQESGGGGAPSWRTSEDYEMANNADVESIDDTNWAWFKDSLLNSRTPHQLPHDHHELIALIAPRAFVTLSGDPGNAWLGAHSEYVSFMAAKEVWKAMGVEDRAGIEVHSQGGAHCQASNGQKQAAQAFVNRFLVGQDANTSIVNGVNADWQAMIDWETPVLSSTP